MQRTEEERRKPYRTPGPGPCSRSPIAVFTIPIRAFTITENRTDAKAATAARTAEIRPCRMRGRLWRESFVSKRPVMVRVRFEPEADRLPPGSERSSQTFEYWPRRKIW
jgi:hypothetical protein